MYTYKRIRDLREDKDQTQKQIAALLSGFGGGFRCGEICGVLSGAVTVLGAKWPHVPLLRHWIR